MDLVPTEALHRQSFGAERFLLICLNVNSCRYELVTFQSKVHKCFHDLKDESWFVVDARKPVSEISTLIFDQVTTTMSNVRKVSRFCVDDAN